MTSTNVADQQELDSQDLEKIRQCATQKSFVKGEVIFAEGDEADNMYFIESGILAVQIQKFTIQETVALLEVGKCFGEMGFFNGEKRSATVIAQTDGELLVVDRTSFMTLLSQDEDLGARVNQIIEVRNRDLALKETLIDDHTSGTDTKFHLGIKGDPSLRESAFMRTRYESAVDAILPQLQQTLYEMLTNRCVYEVLIHFNSGEVLVKSIFNPFVDDIHQASKLISRAYINRHFPLVDFDDKVSMIKRMMMYISGDHCLDNLDEINRSKLETCYQSWRPLKPKEIAQTVSRLFSLRNIPDFYLRNFTISMIRDSIRLQFNCDGTHLLDGKAYQAFLNDNLNEADEVFEIDRRKGNRRNAVSDVIDSNTPFKDRRSPPGRRQEDWEILYQTLN